MKGEALKLFFPLPLTLPNNVVRAVLNTRLVCFNSSNNILLGLMTLQICQDDHNMLICKGRQLVVLG